MEKLVIIHNREQRMFGNLFMPKAEAPCIIMSHGLEGSKDGDKWLVLSKNLYDVGIGTLRFNFRGCGEGKEKSEGSFEDTTLTDRISDYLAAIKFLVNAGVNIKRLGAIGSSFGGMVTIAARDERVKVMVTIAAPYNIASPDRQQFKYLQHKVYLQLDSGNKLRSGFFDDVGQYNIRSEISRVKSPLLIIHGSIDKLVPVWNAYKLYRYANEPKRLEIVEGANHSFDYPEHVDRIVDLSLKWFKSYL